MSSVGACPVVFIKKQSIHYFKTKMHTKTMLMQIRSFYKGMASPMLGMAVINAIVFGVQGNMMKYLEDSMWNHTLTGAVAGGCQSFICSPMELLKLRMQVQTNPTDFFHWSTGDNGRMYHDPWDAVKKIIQKRGMRGLFKGLTLTLVREVPAFGAYFATYDFICGHMVRYKGNGTTFHDLSPILLCISGGISGMAAWIISYPVDVVKSRIQVDGMFGERKYTGAWDCARKSAREPEGWRIFFKGLNSTLVRGFAVNAATFPTVSLILRYWRDRS